MLMQIIPSTTGQAAPASYPPDAASLVRRAIGAQLAIGARHLTVDLSRLRFADSAVIRALVLADRTLSLLGVDQAIEIRDEMSAGADPDR